MSNVRVTQLVGTEGRRVPNLINSDLVERASTIDALTARDFEMLKVSPSARTYLKMQSGDVIYIEETFDWYTKQVQ